jgi:hypothetical protein
MPRHAACTGQGMRLRLLAGYAALAAALGVACSGRTTDVGSPGEPVHGDGGAPESSAGAPADAGSSDPDASSGWVPPPSMCGCCLPHPLGSAINCSCPAGCPPPRTYSDAAGQPGATQVVHCCCGNSDDAPWCNGACPCGSDLSDGPRDAGGQSDAAQVENCQGGCACFGNDEAACKAAGCPWHGTSCYNGPSVFMEAGSPWWGSSNFPVAPPSGRDNHW